MPNTAPWSDVRYKRHVRIPPPPPNSYLLLKVRELKHIRIQRGFLFSEYLPQITLFILGSAWPTILVRASKGVKRGCNIFLPMELTARRLFRLAFWEALYRGPWQTYLGTIRVYLAITILNTCILQLHYLPFRRAGMARSVKKSFTFWDITPCSTSKVNWRSGGTCRSYLQGRRISQMVRSFSNRQTCRWIASS
jgi:hypothetical protein